MKKIRMIAILLGLALVSVGLAACGDDEAIETVTVTAEAGDAATQPDSEKGEVIGVEVGESDGLYFVRPDKATVGAGTVTFAVTNVGELYHEFIVYANADGIDPGDLPVDKEADEAVLAEEDVLGEAPYATPPIVPEDKQPGDADHRIRPEWGAELTVDLQSGRYILLCNIEGHYANKQYSELTVE